MQQDPVYTVLYILYFFLIKAYPSSLQTPTPTNIANIKAAMGEKKLCIFVKFFFNG